MRKLLTVISGSVALFSLSSGVFAENLDAAAISTVHQQVKAAFIDKCKDSLKVSDVICNCLSEKADKALDDSALAQCANDASGGACVTQAVTQAASATMTPAAMDECNKLNAAPAAEAPAAVAPTAQPEPAAPPVASDATPAAPPADAK